MFGFLKSKPLLSDDDREFQFDTYQWLLKNFGGAHFYDDARLILPTKDFFEFSQSDQLAKSIFEQVKAYCGMQLWQCELVAQEPDIDPHVSPTVVLENITPSPAGTFEFDKGDVVTITYNPDLLNKPEALIATFAHELSHFLTSTARDEPPGGWDNWEFATDICATFLGFGIFMANTAFNFIQTQDVDTVGWQVQGASYLSEIEHLYALAIFLSLKDIDAQEFFPFLKPYLRSDLKKAVKELNGSEFIQELKNVSYEGPESAYE